MLRGRCPVCGLDREFTDLPALTKHVSACGRKAKKATPKAPIVAARPLPELPIVLHATRPICSQNDYKANSHWFYVKEAKGWLDHLHALVLQAGIGGLVLPWSRWHILRVYQKPKRAFDFANLVGGAKPVPDALKRLGVIEDDSPKHFECTYDQTDAPFEMGVKTIITLLEAKTR